MKDMNKSVLAVLYIILGILFICMKGDVISLAMTLVGIALLLSSLPDFKNKALTPAIIKAVAGVCIIVFGWAFVSLALYVLAVILILQGGMQLWTLLKGSRPAGGAQQILAYVMPAASLLAGICLLFNQGGTISWVFILTGILLLVEGVSALVKK